MVAEGGAEAFYQGDIAKEIVRFSEESGKLITEKDLANFQVEWQEPISSVDSKSRDERDSP